MGKVSRPRVLNDNEAKASLSNLRTSPQKLNVVAGLIRGRRVSDAVSQLTFMNKKVAADVKQLLLSAIANAENNHSLDVDSLYVAEASVGKSLVMKRFRARARGRVGRIQKPFSNITIVVRERTEDAA